MSSRFPLSRSSVFFLAAILFVLCGLFVVPLIHTRFFPTISTETLVAAFTALATAVFFLWYWREGARVLLPLRLLLLGMLLFSAPLFLTPPLGSTDVYANGYYGRLLTAYHVNPYTVSASLELDDAYFTRTLASHPFQTPYGPLWTSLTAAVSASAGTHVGLTVFLFRLIGLGALMGTAWLVYPSAAPAAILVAWNPFVLFEVVNNAHNDLLMLFFVVAALLVLQRRPVWALPLLTAGILIKYVPILLVPLMCLWILQQSAPVRTKLLILFGGLTVSAGLVAAAFLPYWVGIATFRQLVLVSSFFAPAFYSPVFWLAQLYQGFGTAIADAHIQAAALGFAAFIIVLLCMTRLLFRQGQHSVFLISWLVFAAALLFATRYAQPWYLLWPIVLTPLAFRERHAVLLTAGLTSLGVLSYLVP